MYRKFGKRLFDFVFSLLISVCLFPLFLLCCLAVKLTSKGKVFYLQERAGRNGQSFTIFKLRTMVVGADKSQRLGEEVSANDIRITLVGKVLRRLKLDELAQIINVLKGDMSLVGPRPTLPGYLDEYEKWELQRFNVRPGITGLAQVMGNIELTRLQRSYYDVKYVENVTLFNDLKILCKTVAVLFVGERRFLKVPEDNSCESSDREVKS
jgi:lipopolysaccharide/colanic/teichoic acid biosynthesis glycosyltransferase